MSEISWHGSGPKRSLDFRAVSLVLNADKANPGLEWLERLRFGAEAYLLTLEGISRTGHYDGDAFMTENRTAWEVVGDRFMVSFQPAGWEGLTIRGTWAPTPGHVGVDLEVQAVAGSTGVFRRVEIQVASRWLNDRSDSLDECGSIRVEPRDPLSAAHSYDGREPASILPRFCTMPVAGTGETPFAPMVVPVGGNLHYVELVHPDDVARRVIAHLDDEGGGLQRLHRYELLGHDIEKGVVLRARVRGIWVRSETPQEDAMTLYREFLRKPLPLGP